MPLPLLAIMAAAQGVKALTSGILGGSEMAKANRLEKENPRPVESVPQGVLDSVAYAKQLANLGLPADVIAKAKQDIERSGTRAISSSMDRRSGNDMISTIQQGTNDALLGLEGEQGKAKVAGTQTLINTLGTLAGWQDKIWEWNNAQKFQENAATIRAYRGAGWANINSAMDTAIAGGINVAGEISQNKLPTFTDPTKTNPDLFPSGIPSQYADYLKAVQYYSSKGGH